MCIKYLRPESEGKKLSNPNAAHQASTEREKNQFVSLSLPLAAKSGRFGGCCRR